MERTIDVSTDDSSVKRRRRLLFWLCRLWLNAHLIASDEEVARGCLQAPSVSLWSTIIIVGRAKFKLSVVVKGLRKTVVSVCLLSVEYDVVVVQ
eukprot:scaffold3328_cov184-Alexandrium_tamarense.AAC.9